MGGIGDGDDIVLAIDNLGDRLREGFIGSQNQLILRIEIIGTRLFDGIRGELERVDTGFEGEAKSAGNQGNATCKGFIGIRFVQSPTIGKPSAAGRGGIGDAIDAIIKRNIDYGTIGSVESEASILGIGLGTFFRKLHGLIEESKRAGFS